MRLQDKVAIITGVSYAGQVGFALAKEGKAAGIYVNAIGPGLIVTQSNLESMKPSQDELSKRWVSLEQITEAAIFLVSSASDGVTGAIMPVQGRGI